MVELTCDECGDHVAMILSLVRDEVTATVHPSTACRCVDRLTPDELMGMMEDAYSEEVLSN